MKQLITLICVLVALGGTHAETCTIDGLCPTEHTCFYFPSGTCTSFPTFTSCPGTCVSTPIPVTCTLGPPEGCPSGSTCTPTMTCPSTGACGGVCTATPEPPPTPVPCTVGPSSSCPPGSTCTPTMTCPPTGICGGACISTPAFPPPTTTLPPPTPTPLPCRGPPHHDCPEGFKCLRKGGLANCGRSTTFCGICIPKSHGHNDDDD